MTLRVNRLKVPEPSLRGIWRGLCRVAGWHERCHHRLGRHRAPLDGRYAATERTLRVADSCGLRVIFRSQCTVGRTSLRYQLRPSEVLVVRRRAHDSESSSAAHSPESTLTETLRSA